MESVWDEVIKLNTKTGPDNNPDLITKFPLIWRGRAITIDTWAIDKEEITETHHPPYYVCISQEVGTQEGAILPNERELYSPNKKQKK